MTLKDCTKAELLFVIEQLKFYCGSSGDYYITRVLSDVELKREEKKAAEADQVSAYSCQKRQEYIDLLAPYEGKRLIDIPDSVIRKADAAMKEAQAADRKWCKIMGISGAVGGTDAPK